MAAASVETIRADRIKRVFISGSCLQSLPCQHGVTLILDDGRRMDFYPMASPEIVRLATVAASALVDRKMYAHCFECIAKYDHCKREAEEAHRSCRPVQNRVGRGEPAFEIVYPDDFRPKKLTKAVGKRGVNTPRPKLPKNPTFEQMFAASGFNKMF